MSKTGLGVSSAGSRCVSSRLRARSPFSDRPLGPGRVKHVQLAGLRRLAPRQQPDLGRELTGGSGSHLIRAGIADSERAVGDAVFSTKEGIP